MNGNALREIRTSKRISRQSLADGCGISVPYINMIENGHQTNVGSEKVSAIANFLECSTDELLSETEHELKWREKMKENGLSRWDGNASDAKLALEIGEKMGYLPDRNLNKEEVEEEESAEEFDAIAG